MSKDFKSSKPSAADMDSAYYTPIPVDSRDWVELLVPCTHEGKQHPVGDKIQVTAVQKAWLLKNRMAVASSK